MERCTALLRPGVRIGLRLVAPNDDDIAQPDRRSVVYRIKALLQGKTR